MDVRDTLTSRWQQAALHILNDSRNELYISMRYLDLALSGLRFQIQTELPAIGTDGSVLFAHPKILADLYEKDRRLVNRTYLHIVLHCLLRHLFKNPPENTALWDLSCDIAVESVIDSMHVRPVRTGISALRRNWYDRLSKWQDQCFKSPVPTAERIYRVLSSHSLTDFEKTSLWREFHIDDHSLWPYMTKNAPEPAGPDLPPLFQDQTQKNDGTLKASDNQKIRDLKNRWQEISEKTQTRMETFDREISQGNGDLLDQVQVENRERYDYKKFLRQFAVIREEIQTDPDTFDMIFYTYGLSLYGNMPLMEFQEQKEVHRIQDFVIVIDVSMSTRGDLVRSFLEQTYNVLTEQESYLRKVHIHILQCDEQVREDRRILSRSDLDEYMKSFSLRGGGGTDFRPAFARVRELLDQGEFSWLKGMIYFTDGMGIYPQQAPSWETAFVFMEEDIRERKRRLPPEERGSVGAVPPWAIRLIIPEEELVQPETSFRTDYRFVEDTQPDRSYYEELRSDLLW